MTRIGILGAGKVGIVIAQLALKAGHEVYLSGSSSPEKIALTAKILAPGAHAVSNVDAAKKGDIVILALPLSKYATIPSDALSKKIVIDAMNYWDEVDGPREDIIPASESSSEFIQRFLPTAKIIKALSHMGYHELHDGAKPKGSKNRKSIAIAGDDSYAVESVAKFVDTLGFDPLPLGKLKQGIILEPGYPGFGTNLTTIDLKKVLS